MSFHWSDAEKEQVAAMLRAKFSSQQIGAAMARSRDAIIALVNRTAELKAIGFAHESPSAKHQLAQERKAVTAAKRAAGVGNPVITLKPPLRDMPEPKPQGPWISTCGIRAYRYLARLSLPYVGMQHAEGRVEIREAARIMEGNGR